MNREFPTFSSKIYASQFKDGIPISGFTRRQVEVTTIPSAELTKGETHDHSKALQYIEDLSHKILGRGKCGKETIGKLYNQADFYQTRCVLISSWAFDLQFGQAAVDEKKTTDKEFGILVYLILLEEAYITIETIVSGKPFYAQTLKEYKDSAQDSFYHLDEEGQQLMKQLYDFMADIE